MVRISSKIYNNKKIKEKYILYTSSLSAEGAKAGSKKRKRSTILPISMVQSFFLCSFLFVQIFPYGQVDRLFHMGHGAIPPSLMVLLAPTFALFILHTIIRLQCAPTLLIFTQSNTSVTGVTLDRYWKKWRPEDVCSTPVWVVPMSFMVWTSLASCCQYFFCPLYDGAVWVNDTCYSTSQNFTRLCAIQCNIFHSFHNLHACTHVPRCPCFFSFRYIWNEWILTISSICTLSKSQAETPEETIG